MNIKTITNYLWKALFPQQKTEWFYWWVLKYDCKIQWIKTKKLQSIGFLTNPSVSVFIKFLEQFESYISNEWYEISPYYIHTITKGENWDIPLDRWYVVHILLPKKAFKDVVLLSEDKKDNSLLRFQSYFSLPFLLWVRVLYAVIRSDIEWADTFIELQNIILDMYWVNIIIVFILLLVIIWFIGWKIFSYVSHRWKVAIDDVEFEKFFDITSRDKLWVRTFFTPDRINFFKDRAYKNWIKRILFKEKDFFMRFPKKMWFQKTSEYSLN